MLQNLSWGQRGFQALVSGQDLGACMRWAWYVLFQELILPAKLILPVNAEYHHVGPIPNNYRARCNSYC